MNSFVVTSATPFVSSSPQIFVEQPSTPIQIIENVCHTVSASSSPVSSNQTVLGEINGNNFYAAKESTLSKESTASNVSTASNTANATNSDQQDWDTWFINDYFPVVKWSWNLTDFVVSLLSLLIDLDIFR